LGALGALGALALALALIALGALVEDWVFAIFAINTSKSNSTTKSITKSFAKSAKSLARQSERLNAQVKAFAGTSDDDDETDDDDAMFLFSKYRPTKEFLFSDEDSDDAKAWHKHVKAFCKSHLGKGKKYDTFPKCVKAAMETYKSIGYSHDNPCEGCGATGEYSQVEPTYCSCN
jgi:hypothetical protein